ncbi:MAG: histidine triad nucleotide-binding protein [Gammaproteobacteria bacterium]
MQKCIFCQILNGEVATDFLYQDENFVAFKDIRPKAPTHVLVIPREHIESLNHVTEYHKTLMGNLMLVIPRIAKQIGLSGFKTQFNTGSAGGQEVFHLHAHILGGK